MRDMNLTRLDELLNRFSDLHVLVVGDFFLDKYLIIDRQISEVSLETGLEAYQVIDIRCSPGAAGTVTSNLRALGVKVTALGVIGDDGQSYKLKQGLTERGVDIEPLIERADRFTPTYTKPMVRESDGREHEIQRLDIKNRSTLPTEAEDLVIGRLRALVPQMDGVIVADQVQEANYGVVTDRVRAEIGELALHHPGVVFAADSRARIGLFQHVIVKPNAQEAILAVRPDWAGEANSIRQRSSRTSSAPTEREPSPALSAVEGFATPEENSYSVDLELVKESGTELFRRNRKPVFLTVGAQGILLFTEAGCEPIPAVPVSGEIDIVGAGDSVMAGIVSALCSGAEPAEAALLGNLVASITIQQIGTTGTATPAQVREQFRQVETDLFVGLRQLPRTH
jgi:bifunctional ADP-heptose synthase (sugar kinase/adenylyltransferase)